MSSKSKSAPSLHSFLAHNCGISYGAINMVVNALIFYLSHLGKPSATFTAADIFLDLVITSFILSVIVAFFAFLGVKTAQKQGIAPSVAFAKQDHLLIKSFPDNKLVVALLTALICVVTVPAFFTGLVSGLSLVPLSLLGTTVVKGVACGVAGAITGYFCIMSALLSQAKKQASVAAIPTT